MIPSATVCYWFIAALTWSVLGLFWILHRCEKHAAKADYAWTPGVLEIILSGPIIMLLAVFGRWLEKDRK